MPSFVRGMVACFLALHGLNAMAQSVPAATRAEIAPSGTLRAAINYNNPLLAKRDAATGELNGLAVDLSRELARRIGVPVQLLPYDAAGKISGSARSGEWDIGFLAIDPERAADIDYTAAHIQLEGTYLVPAGSPLQKIEDVDRDGVRIAVTSKSAYDLFLSRELKHAKIVHADTTPLSIEMMVAQKLDAVAAVRTALISGVKGLPGARVMAGHFMTIPQAAAIPKGRPAAARYIRTFIEEMKSSGFVAAALKRQGLGPDDAIVAPPAEHVYAVNYLDVRPASAAAATALLAAYRRDSRAETGSLALDAFQESGRSGRFVVVESWWDQASFVEHEKAAHTLAFRDKLRAIQLAPLDQRVNHAFTIDPRPTKSGPGSVLVVTHVDVPGARREEAEALLKRLFAASHIAPGHLQYDVYQQNDPRTNHFSVFAAWESQRAFDDYGSSQAAQQFREAITPMLGALYDERLYRAIGTGSAK